MQQHTIRFGGPITPVVKKLLIANIVIYLIQVLLKSQNTIFGDYTFSMIFGLTYNGIFENHWYWQVFSYMFLHGSFWHIFLNMLALWMFAGELEERWGSKLFLKYYLICGLGAGLFISVMNWYLFTRYQITGPTIGASGAIFGLLLAFGLTWPNRTILLFFIIPMKMKYAITLFGLIELWGTIQSTTGKMEGISHIGHIGGLITGLIFILVRSRMSKPIVHDDFIEVKAKSSGIFSGLRRKIRLRKKKKEIEKRIEAKKTVDRILDKISREGMSSLTKKEKLELDKARKNYYPNSSDTLH